jgi:hypothetical protein
MAETEFDGRLRRAVGEIVEAPGDAMYVAAASHLPSQAAAVRRPGQVVLLVAAIGLAGVAVFRLASGPSAGAPGRASVTLASTPIEAVVAKGALTVSISGSVVAEAPVPAANLATLQLVCTPDVGLESYVILVGSRGNDQGDILVDGLGKGQLASGADGAFIFAVTPVPTPGTGWTVHLGASNVVSGHIAQWGIRESASSSQRACLLVDPSQEQLKR